MSGLLVLGVLTAVAADVVSLTKDPPMLAEIKRRYKIIRESLPAEDRWKLICKRPSIITGTSPGMNTTIGLNVNKGYEIYICLDGDDVNSATYVLIHEMAHMSVPEYSHSDKFWDNFKKLKKICIDAGLYEPTGTRNYCGDTLID